MSDKKVVQISGTARRPDRQGLTEGLIAQLNNVEKYWKDLRRVTAAFRDDRSAGIMLTRYAAKIWILSGGTPLGFVQTAQNWIDQYEKSKGYDITDEDDKPATPDS